MPFSFTFQDKPLQNKTKQKKKKKKNKKLKLEKVFKKKTQAPPIPLPLNPARLVILLGDTSSHPVLHFYQVSSKYCEGYSSYRADRKSNSNIRRGDNSKNKKARVVILVCTCRLILFYIATK